jgi:chromosome segregation ATPase
MGTESNLRQAEQERNAAVAALGAAETEHATAVAALKSLDKEVQADIGSWDLTRQAEEREQRTWAVNLAQAEVNKAAAKVREASNTVKGAKAAYLADPEAREAAAQRYIAEAARINTAIHALGRDIKALDELNSLWQQMSEVQQPDIYRSMAKERLADGSDRVRQLEWVISTVRTKEGVLIPATPHMSRANAVPPKTAVSTGHHPVTVTTTNRAAATVSIE